jgi:5-methylcytosine-specific restriction endonuclease McrA
VSTDTDQHAPARVDATRYIPEPVRREVWARDQGRCTFVDRRGIRCEERSGLELHHRVPFCRGGPTTVENLTLHCRAHNALAAERDLGRDYMDRRKHEAQDPRPHR